MGSERSVSDFATLCRLRCADHREIVGDLQPEWLVRLVVREWPAIRSFERQRAKNVERAVPDGASLPAAFVRWEIPDWADLREFLCHHGGDKLQLITADGEVLPIATKFGDLLPAGYGKKEGVHA